jgi:hypothetical protein
MRRCPALLVVAALAGCGRPEGQLTLRLVPPGFEDPFAQVSQLSVRVLDRDFGLSYELGPADSGVAHLELGLLEGAPLRLEVLGRNSGGRVQARGVTRLLSPVADESPQELVPFASAGAAAMVPVSALGTPLAVDGSLAEWRVSPALILQESGTSGGLRAELYLAWSSQELRFAVQVTDDCVILRAGPDNPCGNTSLPDRVALGLDAKGDGGEALGDDDLWVEIAWSQLTVVHGPSTLSRDDVPVAISALADRTGWTIEGSVRLAALGRGELKAGDVMGLDLVILDQDAGLSEPVRVSWSGALGPMTPPNRMGRVGPGAL